MPFPLYQDDDSGSHIVRRAGLDRGWDIVRAEDVGMSGRADVEHLTYAREGGRATITANIRDFVALHRAWLRQGEHHAGIILVRQQTWSAGEVVRRPQRMQDAFGAEDMVDRIEWLSRWGEDADEA